MRARPSAPGHVGEMLDALATHIDNVLDAHDDYGRRTRWEAAPGSPLEYEQSRMRRQMGPSGTAAWDGSDASLAAEIAALFGQLAAQHLDAIRVLLIEREVMFSLAPLTRAVLEIAGHVFWLLDIAIHESPRDRAARVLLARIDDATRRRTAAKPVAHPNLEEMTLSLRRLRREDLPAKFYPSEIEEDASGRIKIRGQDVPGLAKSLRYIEEVTGVDWNTPGMYAYLSNASHPTFHVVREAYEFDETTGKGAFVARDGRLPYKLTRSALMSFIRIWQINAKYRGLDAEEAGDLGEQIAELPSPDDLV
jgi:hypothetical protein